MAGKRKASVPPRFCVACGQCVKECPMQAIQVYKGMYAVVSDACVGCGRCAKACPAGIITLEGAEGSAT